MNGGRYYRIYHPWERHFGGGGMRLRDVLKIARLCGVAPGHPEGQPVNSRNLCFSTFSPRRFERSTAETR